MAMSIESTVALHNDKDFVTLGQLREFVEETKMWGAEHKVSVQVFNGQRDPFVKMEVTMGKMANA